MSTILIIDKYKLTKTTVITVCKFIATIQNTLINPAHCKMNSMQGGDIQPETPSSIMQGPWGFTVLLQIMQSFTEE